MCVYIIMPPSHTFVHTNEDMTRLIYMQVWRIQGEARGLPSLLVHMCDMTRSCVGHYTFICVTWLIHTCDMTRLHVWKGEARSLSSLLVHMRGPSLWYGRHETCTCVTWHSYTRDMTRGRATWLIRMCEKARQVVYLQSWYEPGDVEQCVAVCCSVLQCVAVWCSLLHTYINKRPIFTIVGSPEQCVAACCSMLQHVAVCCSVLQCVAVCCSVLQCVACVHEWEAYLHYWR